MDAMTAPDPADVIEVAAKIIYNNIGARPAARALHDAGLLADPADRDWQMCDQDACEYTTMFKARAERAEAEVARLRATVDRVRALADEWEDDGPGCQLWPAYRQLRAALDGAGEQQ